MTDEMPPPTLRLALAEFTARTADPWWSEPFSAAFGHPALVLDIDDAPRDDDAIATLAERLSRLPCPVIGVRGTVPVPAVLAAALDVLIENESDLAPLLRNVERHPVAAAVLVQVLRHNARCSVEDGLLTESFAFGILQCGAEFRGFLVGRATPVSTPDGDETPLLLDRQGDRLILTFNRPHARNAYSAGLRDAFHEALMLVRADPTIAHVEVRGTGSCFCTGGELAEFGLATDPTLAHSIRQARPVPLLLATLADRLAFRLHRACIGSGIEMPAFASRVTATPDTFFQLPEITMGLIPGAGGTVSIPRRIGRQRTAYFALSAKRIDAATALAWGLIDAID